MKIRVAPDTESLAWLVELRVRLEAFSEAVEKPLDIVNLIRSLPRGPDAFQFETVAEPTGGDCRIIVTPCKALLCLMTALRAFDGDIELVDAPSIAARATN